MVCRTAARIQKLHLPMQAAGRMASAAVPLWSEQEGFKATAAKPPPHRGQSPLWKNAVTPAMPSTSPLRRILGRGAFVGGNHGFPTTFERSASERIPHRTSRKSKNTPENPGCSSCDQSPASLRRGAFVGGTMGSLPHLSGAPAQRNPRRSGRFAKQTRELF